MIPAPLRKVVRYVTHRALVGVGATASTLACFLVLPLMQSLHQPPETDLIVQSLDTTNIPPPPPPPEEEPEPEEEEAKEEPLELTEEAPPLDLAQLELALDPSVGGAFLGGDFAVKLGAVGAEGAGSVEALFAMADLDQKPRVLYQPSPVLSAEMKKRAPGTVHVIFVVDERGRVESPLVQKSSDPIFEAPALAAVKQWRFDSGKRNGQPVRFRMSVPITFPKGS